MGGLLVGNLYALRATDPRALWRHPNPVGEANDQHLRDMADRAQLIVAGWGSHGRWDRIREVVEILGTGRLHALGLTVSGAPRHPLYLPATARPEQFFPAPAQRAMQWIGSR